MKGCGILLGASLPPALPGVSRMKWNKSAAFRGQAPYCSFPIPRGVERAEASEHQHGAPPPLLSAAPQKPPLHLSTALFPQQPETAAR